MDVTTPRAGARALLALACLYLATAICVVEHHVHIVLSEPATYLNPFHHKCGLLGLSMLVWAVAEGIWLSVSTPNRLQNERQTVS